MHLNSIQSIGYGQFKSVYETNLMLSDTKCKTSVNPAKYHLLNHANFRLHNFDSTKPNKIRIMRIEETKGQLGKI